MENNKNIENKKDIINIINLYNTFIKNLNKELINIQLSNNLDLTILENINKNNIDIIRYILCFQHNILNVNKIEYTDDIFYKDVFDIYNTLELNTTNSLNTNQIIDRISEYNFCNYFKKFLNKYKCLSIDKFISPLLLNYEIDIQFHSKLSVVNNKFKYLDLLCSPKFRIDIFNYSIYENSKIYKIPLEIENKKNIIKTFKKLISNSKYWSNSLENIEEIFHFIKMIEYLELTFEFNKENF